MKIIVGLLLLLMAGCQLEARHSYLKPQYLYKYGYKMHSLVTLPETGNRQTGTYFKGEFVIYVPPNQDIARFEILDICIGNVNMDLRAVDEDEIEWNCKPVTDEWSNVFKYPVDIVFHSDVGRVSLNILSDEKQETLNFKKALITHFLLNSRVATHPVSTSFDAGNPPSSPYDTFDSKQSSKSYSTNAVKKSLSNPDEDTDVFKVYEDSIGGINDVLYVVERLPSAEYPEGSVLNVTKFYNFHHTDTLPTWNRTTHIPNQCADCDADDDEHLLTKTVKTEYSINEGRSPMAIEEIVSYGVTKFSPLGDDGADYIYVNETVNITLIGAELRQNRQSSSNIGSNPIKSLAFVFPTAYRASNSDPLKDPLIPFLTDKRTNVIDQAKRKCSEMISQIMKEATGEQFTISTSILFLSCARLIRKLKYDEVRITYEDVCLRSSYQADCKTIMVDVMMSSRSPPAYLNVLKLIVDKQIEESRAIRAAQLLTPFEPTRELIDEVFKILEVGKISWPVRRALTLTAAGLLRKACDGPDGDIPNLPLRPGAKEYCPDEYESKWVALIGKRLQMSKMLEYTLLYLEALGETMLPTAIEWIKPYAEDSYDEMIQTVALFNLKKIAVFAGSEVQPIVENEFYDLDNTPMVRIAALKGLLASNSDTEVIQKIASWSDDEPHDDVKGYITRFIREYSNATHYCMKDLASNCRQVSENVDEEDENGAFLGSSLWEFSTLFDDLGFSTHSELSMLSSNASMFPEVFTYKSNQTFAGYSYTPLKVYLHAKGIHGLLKKYLGPQADYNEEDRTYINSKIGLQYRKDEPFHLHGVFKFGDTTTRVIHIDQKQLESFNSEIWTSLRRGVDIHRHMLSIPYEFKTQIPSWLGIPLQFFVLSSKIASIIAKVQFNIDFDATSSGATMPGVIQWQYSGKISYTAYNKIVGGTFNPFDVVLSNVGVRSFIHLGPQLDIDGSLHLIDGELGITATPTTKSGPQPQRPKLLSYQVQPFSNQYLVTNVGDVSGLIPIKNTPYPQVQHKLDLSETFLQLPIILSRKSELENNDYAAFKEYFDNHNFFSFLHSWWVTGDFAARTYEVYFKDTETPKLQFSGKWKYTPTSIEESIMKAKTSGKGFWNLLAGYAQIPPSCVSTYSSRSGPSYYASNTSSYEYGSSYDTPSYDTEPIKSYLSKKNESDGQYYSGSESGYSGSPYRPSSPQSPLDIRTQPASNQVSILSISWKAVTSESSEIKSVFEFKRDTSNHKDTFHGSFTVDTPSRKSQYCTSGNIDYPEMPCSYYSMEAGESAPPVTGSFNVKWGTPKCQEDIISTRFAFTKTEEQKILEGSKDEWYYKQCKEDQGRNIRDSYACRYVIYKLSSLNKFFIDAQYKSLPKPIKRLGKIIDTYLKAELYTKMTNNPVDIDNGAGRLKIEFELFEKVPGVANIRLFKEKENTFFHKVLLSDYLPYVYPVSTKVTMLQNFIEDITDEAASSTCTVGGHYFTTFDNSSYSYELKKCYHVLAKDCSPFDLFAVTVAQQDASKGPTKAIKVYVLGHEFEVTATSQFDPKYKVFYRKEEVEVYEDRVTTAKSTTEPYLNLALFMKTGKVLHIKLPHFGVHITHSGNDVSVEVSTLWSGYVCGLCGQYDGASGLYDLTGPDQCAYADYTSFASSYLIPDGCYRPQNLGKLCGKVNYTLYPLTDYAHEPPIPVGVKLPTESTGYYKGPGADFGRGEY